MKSVISTTYDDKYLYFLPIVTWCWNKLGVDVICFMPYENRGNTFMHVNNTLVEISKGHNNWIYNFDCPEHKEATYAQVSRLYAACLDLPEDEILITSDVDMVVFKIPIPELSVWDKFVILGNDLVPKGQYPVCYCSAKVKVWKDTFRLNGKTYQECLDNLLGAIECDHMRGNYWGCDQEQLWNNISKTERFQYSRSNGQNQFATMRYDRDDAYILDRLDPDTIDFHMNRPGYEENNFNIILTILKYHYPYENFDWLITYTNSYRKLL